MHLEILISQIIQLKVRPFTDSGIKIQQRQKNIPIEHILLVKVKSTETHL